MHFQFLIEDQSGAVLIEKVMSVLVRDDSQDTYDYKAFRGIGGFTRKNTVKETHSGKLLNDLATYMRGFQRSLQGIAASLIIVLDNDNNNPKEFMGRLNKVAVSNGIEMDYVFCLAIEEMEAWLLGDEIAIQKAYPKYKRNVLHDYKQDSICGTWEILADVVFKGGIREIRKKKMSYVEIGKLKSEWAGKIGDYMVFEDNKSPSFQVFYRAICDRIGKVA